MPTSVLRPAMMRRPAPLGWRPSWRPVSPIISLLSEEAIGAAIDRVSPNTLASSTYPAASRVLAFPFELAEPFLVRKVWWCNGTTATTDSADVGVYNEAGTTLLVSGGSTAIATANVVQEKDCTDTLLTPGRYWCAYVQGGVTATPFGITVTSTWWRYIGCAQMAGSGSTLGSTFTPASIASNVFPYFGIASRTQVA